MIVAATTFESAVMANAAQRLSGLQHSAQPASLQRGDLGICGSAAQLS
jgi:hypothetical protein